MLMQEADVENLTDYCVSRSADGNSMAPAESSTEHPGGHQYAKKGILKPLGSLRG